MRKDFQEYYRVLGLNPGASAAKIRHAYRQLIQRWHPDHFKAGSLMQTTAEDLTKEINEAYEQLYKKQRYKKYLSPGGPKPPGAKPPFVSSPRTRSSSEGATPRRREKPPAPSSRASPLPRQQSKRRFRRRPWTGVAAGLVLIAGFFSVWPHRPSQPASRPATPPTVVEELGKVVSVGRQEGAKEFAMAAAPTSVRSGAGGSLPTPSRACARTTSHCRWPTAPSPAPPSSRDAASP